MKHSGECMSDTNIICFFDRNAFLDLHSHPWVQHALNVRKAIQTDNYFDFFQLFKQTPNLGKYILNLMLNTWRIQALQKIMKAYKPRVEVSYIRDVFAFDSLEECELFLKETGCSIIESVFDEGSGSLGGGGTNTKFLDTKNSLAEVVVVKQESLLL
jgi:hypothetical protein